jgi:hypothetical protein
MSTQKREFSKKRRNGTMRKKMKGGVWYDPRTWNSSSEASTAEVPTVEESSIDKTKQSWADWFSSFGKKKETTQDASAVVGGPTQVVQGPPNQGGAKRKNKRSRNSKK